MDDKKSFFASLDSKSALLVGLIGGFLSLCTIGFVSMLVMLMTGTLSFAGGGSTYVAPVATAQQPAANTAPTTPPANIPKASKPKAELFVMSYCPFGLQMEKAILPVMDLLGKKADIDIKFVSYAMHELQEVEENTRQYCIQKDQNNKFQAYLKCFTASGDAKACGVEAGVNENSVNSCVTRTNKEFAIMDKYNDKSTWLSGQFPLYPIHEDLNNKYGVQGSPTLVINGVQAEVSRSPEAVKQAICASFEDVPKECETVLSSAATSPGFGTAVGAAPAGGAAPGCGV